MTEPADEYDELWSQTVKLLGESDLDQKEIARHLHVHESTLSRLGNEEIKPSARAKATTERCRRIVALLRDFIGPSIRIRSSNEVAKRLADQYPLVDFDVVRDTRRFPAVAIAVAGRILQFVEPRAEANQRTTLLTPGGPNPLCVVEAMSCLSNSYWDKHVTIAPALGGGWGDDDENSPVNVVKAIAAITSADCEFHNAIADYESLWDSADVIFMSVGHGRESFLHQWLTSVGGASAGVLSDFVGDIMYVPFAEGARRIDAPQIDAGLQQLCVLKDADERLRDVAARGLVVLGVDNPEKADITAVALELGLASRCIVTESVADRLLDRQAAGV